MTHIPVLLSEVIDHIQPIDGGVYVDGTFGAGGYTSAMLDAADCTVIAIDRDAHVREHVERTQQKYGDRFIFVRGAFGDVQDLLRQTPHNHVDGFVLDIGVSSMHLDNAQRGFSFRFDAPLDMRMDDERGMTAADIVNTYEEEPLANVIYKYGEERLSRRVAHKIVERRKTEKFTCTGDLADIVRSCVPQSKDGIDPATRTFQALRIAVNDELGQLESALNAAPQILKSNGRVVVVSFHSLEDRIVKHDFKNKSGKAAGQSRHMPQVNVPAPAIYKLITRKAIKAGAVELEHNPRSRSARLRCAQKLEGTAS